ncbi:RCC1 domain-containing protein [Micavibrio aeruginosavorus]|uniref:RCC1 domain-containing protein n=1 Tax=Micavibrio aeruginosavorus TaxID=349221 RepID=UPI001F21FF03|nr:chromosome condensation regulator RCC1 [Micavibrio aeruginosavorus]
MMRIIQLLTVLLFLFWPLAPAYADCASPAGVAGDVIWNETAERPAYCDGTNWRNFLKENAASSGVNAITVGGNSACARKPGGELYCWGSNADGSTGLGTTSGIQSTPAQVGIESDWTQVSSTRGLLEFSTCGLRDKVLYCWGSRARNIPSPSSTSGVQTTPIQVGSFTDWDLVHSGTYHACAIRGGALYCWGYNGYGQIGVGYVSAGNITTPTQIGTATDWTDVAGGTAHTCGLRGTGELYCWGSNGGAATGRGLTSGETLVPTKVGTDTDWEKITAGNQFSCGIRAGELYCWGSNGNGMTGRGTTSGNTTTPTKIGTETNWDFVATGILASCGLRDGALYCWGANNSGVTGQGLISGSTNVPTQVGTNTDWNTVALAISNACGLRGSDLYCWGTNTNGATGIGTTSGNQLTPALVEASWGSFGSGGGGSGGSGPCTAPDGVVGDIVYNATHHVLQYCDGAVWHAVGPTLGATGAGCANPAGVEGDIIFNTTHNKVQYCNGTGWHHVAPAF